MASKLFDLTGKVAIVTGAGRGLGRAMALGLAEAGAKVAAAARTKPEIEATAKTIRDASGEAIAVPFDAVKREDCRRLVAETVKRFGGLDVMVVDHGIGYAEKAEDITDAELDRMLAINLRGAIVCAQEAAKRMIEQARGGSIILVSSTSSWLGFAGLTSYAAAKAGVDGAARNMALEWGPHNIRVNTINPGYMTHHMRSSDERHDYPEETRVIRERTPLQRKGRPEELVGPVVFLASDASSFVTGHTMPVDGGWCAA
jgi:NAD(P)-dependent dehydrogenase (short-subunit alcohol dehydrogenase family)